MQHKTSNHYTEQMQGTQITSYSVNLADIYFSDE